MSKQMQTPYAAPIADTLFNFKQLIGTDRLANLPHDILEPIVTEAAKFAEMSLVPLNWPADQQGAQIANGAVTTPDGFKNAYAEYIQAGWNGLCATPDFGGQGLPFVLALAVQEYWQSACISWALAPLLNQGAIELLSHQGNQAQQQKYLAKIISGAWACTMNLTEPQAGSDVGQVACKAKKQGEHYRVTGQKIYISYGEHDLTDNIIHLVLARIEGAAEGTKGLSLFLVPKFIVNDDGSIGPRNDLRAVSLEHKLGQHGSPTCVMAYGDNEGAYAELVGQEGDGIAGMFIMMNNARLSVGVQGIAIAERAYQQALDYAKNRIQSKAIDRPKAPAVAIIKHPDVRRMLLTMRSQIEAARALALDAASAVDLKNQSRVDLLTPIVKAFSTDLANEVCSLAIQVHGGMGFIEETGVAQHYRDARVLAIYEGTNGIQANDLVFRKVLRDEGAALKLLFTEAREVIYLLAKLKGDDAAVLARRLDQSLVHAETATRSLLQSRDMQRQAAAASPYLRLLGLFLGGLKMAQSFAALMAMSQNGESLDPAFADNKTISIRFYADNILPQTSGLLPQILDGHSAILAFSE